MADVTARSLQYEYKAVRMGPGSGRRRRKLVLRPTEELRKRRGGQIGVLSPQRYTRPAPDITLIMPSSFPGVGYYGQR